MNNSPLITIVTPTYNRAHTLPGVYKSLISQSNQSFMWLIVDDGSTDDTEQVVNNWIKKNSIRIEYIKKTNGGKADALNVALDHINTRYVTCLDSDDTFFPDTVSIALNLLQKTEKDAKCCGVLALRTAPNGTVMGGKEIPHDREYVKAEDIFLHLGLRTELICFYKTDIITKFRFPVFAGEKFVSPSWMQFEITQDHYFLTSWDRLCECEYISDGLTRNKRKLIVKNPHGYTEVKRQQFKYSKSIKMIMKNGIMYDCGCLLGRDKAWLNNAPKKIWAILLMPIAFAVKKQRFNRIKT